MPQSLHKWTLKGYLSSGSSGEFNKLLTRGISPKFKYLVLSGEPQNRQELISLALIVETSKI